MTIIDEDGDQIFSSDYSYITCKICKTLLSPDSRPLSCSCGYSILCLNCQTARSLRQVMYNGNVGLGVVANNGGNNS